MKKLVVVGCGISGLSSGLLLARAGFDVKIISKDLPPNTTSNKAAAFWSPYYVAGDRVARWKVISSMKSFPNFLSPASRSQSFIASEKKSFRRLKIGKLLFPKENILH